MRVWKLYQGTTTRYRHDGQTGVEDLEVNGSSTTVTRYGLGARGVEPHRATSGSAVTTGCPLHDAGAGALRSYPAPAQGEGIVGATFFPARAPQGGASHRADR